MPLVRAFVAALLVLSAVSCGWLADPSRTCTEQATDYGPGFSVAGAFATTAGRVRSLYPTANQLIPEGVEPDGETVILCYLDGELPKGPPPIGGGEIEPNFDRAVVAVVNETATPLLMGYRDDIAVRDPSE